MLKYYINFFTNKNKKINNQEKNLIKRSISNNSNFKENSKYKNLNIKFTIKDNKKLQNKLLNHITRNGKKYKSEKTVIKSFKASQKHEKKNHEKLFKLSVLNSIPTFKIVKLTNKKRRKKSVKEIPTFVSNYSSRVSLGLKHLVTSATIQNEQNAFFKKLKTEFLSSATSENQTINTKNNLQTKALQEKKYFRFYRW